MQRLPINFTKNVFGKDMLKDLRPASAEFEVEDVYKHSFMLTSNMNMKTIKKRLPGSKCATDGLIEFCYGHRTFMGIQEVKYKKAFTDWQLKQQLIQALMYEWMFETAGTVYDMKVYILNSNTYFAYVYADEILAIKKELWKIFPTITESPCVAFSNKNVQAVIRKKLITINKSKITDEYALHTTIREIYKHCL